MIKNYDIVIVGAGLVGTSLILALKSLGLKIAVLETHLPDLNSTAVDGRPLSLSYGSHQILQSLGLWSELAEYAVAIDSVHISQQKRLGSLNFYAEEEQVPALGYAVPMELVQRLLYQKSAQIPGVDFVSIQQLLAIESTHDIVQVTVKTVQGEQQYQAKLLIGADGAHSTVRQLLNINAEEKNCQQLALTMTLQFRNPLQNIAYERFNREGSLAILPLKNPNQGRLVFILSQDFSQEIQGWSDHQFLEYFNNSFNSRIEAIEIIDRGPSHPLNTITAQEQIRPGVVLLGNAARTIYPLAAQGFNLALRDTATLVDVLSAAHAEGKNLGDIHILQQYDEWRRADQRWVSHFTGKISEIFGLKVPLLASLRGLSLVAVDLCPPLKHSLAKKLMGISGRLPRLARGVAL